MQRRAGRNDQEAQHGVKPIGRPVLLVLPGTVWLLAFGLTPLLFMFAMSFWSSGMFGTRPDFTLANYARLFDSPLFGALILKTLRISLTCTALALLISYPIAYFLTRQRGAPKAFFIILVFLPFWTSHVVRTFVWLPILGRNGAINGALMWLGVIDTPVEWLLYNEGAVYVGLVYVYTLFMMLPIYVSLEKIDPGLIEAAIDLGAGPASVFRHILLPLSWPGVLSGSIMVFLLGVGAFVTPQLLGGPSGVMYGNIIASQFINGNNWAFGATLSVVLIAIVLVSLAITSRWIGLRKVFTAGRSE